MKHILQICLLLAICFWLVYQVKHSHEKRKEFDTKDEKLVGKVQIDGEIQRLGRKDLPRVTQIATDVEKHSDEEEEEKEAEEEENKHEEDEPEKEESGIKDTEEEAAHRGGGDDEIDENEPKKTEAEHEHENEPENTEAEQENEEEQVNEDKEVEENGDVGKEDNPESEEHEDAEKQDHTGPEENEDGRKEDDESDAASNDHDHDGNDRNTHEAREEQYKADDASSEVAHDIQRVIPETENVTAGHSNELPHKVNFGQENETKTSDKNDVGSQPREDEVNNNGTSSNVTVTELKKLEINTTMSEDSSLQNSTLPILQNDPESSGLLLSNGTQTASDAMLGDSSLQNSTLPILRNNPESSSLLLSNGTKTASNAELSQNATVKSAPGDKEPNLQGNVTEPINKPELAVDDKNKSEVAAGSNNTLNANANAGESLTSSNSTSASSHKMDGSDYHSSDEGVNAIQHDPIDASDTTLTQEEKRSATDLDTLPEIRTEVHNTDNTMAE